MNRTASRPSTRARDHSLNHRRALRASTDTGLAIFPVLIAGVVLWTSDEALRWNLLPDWIDRYAQLLVILLSILLLRGSL